MGVLDVLSRLIILLLLILLQQIPKTRLVLAWLNVDLVVVEHLQIVELETLSLFLLDHQAVGDYLFHGRELGHWQVECEEILLNQWFRNHYLVEVGQHVVNARQVVHLELKSK